MLYEKLARFMKHHWSAATEQTGALAASGACKTLCTTFAKKALKWTARYFYRDIFWKGGSGFMESHKRIVQIGLGFRCSSALPEFNLILKNLVDQPTALRPQPGEHSADLGERVQGSLGSLRVLWVSKK